MSRTLFEIGRACLIAGFVFLAFALIVAPSAWWLGVFASLPGGYLSYRFRDVLKAVPQAWAAAKEKSGGFGWDVANNFLSKPHPIGVLAAAVSVGVFSTFWCWEIGRNGLPESGDFFAGSAVIGFIAFVPSIASFYLFFLLAMLGAWRAGVYWHTADDPVMGTNQYVEWVTEKKMNGLMLEELTYTKGFAWVLGGVMVILNFLLWQAWFFAIKFLVIYIDALIRVIHSNERLLCAVDGTLGGLITLWAFSQFGPLDASLGMKLLVCVCGGLVGAALGIANWELVSKRIYGFGNNTA